MATCLGQVPFTLQIEKTTIPASDPNIAVSDASVPFRFADTSALEFVPESFVYERCVTKSDCNEVQVAAPAGTFCEGSTVSLKASRNASCTLPVQWRVLEPSGYAISVINDNEAKLSFNAAGRYRVVAQVGSCRVSADTVSIQVEKAVFASLAPDIRFCAGDSMVLNAGAGFRSYLWQDGSRDSLLRVSNSGNYYVNLTDYCGNALQVATRVQAIVPPPLQVGVDTLVCWGDSLSRTASGGYEQYVWRDLATQEIVSSTSRLELSVKADRRISLTATTAMGCTKKDTLRMQVIAARPFELGSDLSICTGDTVSFSAPAGYQGYQWNTGANARSIRVWQAGSYRLTATDVNGCRFQDSVSVKAVFSLPRPDLGVDKAICQGSSLQLSPGIFSRYQWQDGNTSGTLSVSVPGTYAVQVWDGNNCSAYDTMRITSLLPLPANFLKDRDSICQYDKLQLKPSQAFKSYAWSTGSTQQSISVEKPGNYVLKVTDQNNCPGQDTIQVVQKNCMEGLYVPTAFTPNRDGKNGLFRPLLFGNVVRFQFQVYNRFGELVFASSKIMEGWNGTHKGVPQPTGSFVWFCQFELEGKPLETRKGTVLLMR
jgi:gliding motility-associated-like protein